jgi:hypothetical protein
MGFHGTVALFVPQRKRRGTLKSCLESQQPDKSTKLIGTGNETRINAEEIRIYSAFIRGFRLRARIVERIVSAQRIKGQP